MKKLLSAILSTVMVISLCAPAAWAASFSDVPEGHWSYSFVEKAASNELVSGTGGGAYAPEQTVSNAEWATMLSNLFFPEGVENYKNMFGTSGNWWQPYMTVAASQQKLFEGTAYRSDTDRVTAEISRYDMAQVIYNLSQNQQWQSVDTTSTSDRIGDWSAVPAAYQTAVAYCFGAGFVTGVDQHGTFYGEGSMTRGAAAVVLCRLLDAKNGEHDFGSEVQNPPSDNGNSGDDTATPTAVKDMITVTATGENKYSITLDVPEYNGTTLSNGKPITEENIKAMLDELQEVFPHGTSWAGRTSEGDMYYYGMHAGCNSFAYMTRDLLFGKGSMQNARTHSDLTTVKAGDVLYLYDQATANGHWCVVTGTLTSVSGYKYFLVCDGNVSSKVSWSGQYAPDNALLDYPDTTVYNFY